MMKQQRMQETGQPTPRCQLPSRPHPTARRLGSQMGMLEIHQILENDSRLRPQTDPDSQ